MKMTHNTGHLRTTALALLLAGFAGLLTACPHTRRGDKPVGPPVFGPDLREGHGDRPEDQAWSVWVDKGDTRAAADAFDDIVEADRSSVLARFGQAEVALHRARFSEGFAAHRSIVSEYPDDPLAEFSALRMWEMRDHIPGWAETMLTMIAEMRGKKLPPAVRGYLGLMHVHALHRASRNTGRAELFDGTPAGFSQRWRVAGPFSIFGFYDRTTAYSVDDDIALADRYEAAGFVRETREQVIDGPTAAFSFGITGVHVLESWVEVPERTRVVAQLFAGADVQVWIDDLLVFDRDTARGYPPNRLGALLELAPGPHRIRMKVAVTQVGEVASIMLTPESGAAPEWTFSARPQKGATKLASTASRTDLPARDFFDPISGGEARGHAFLQWLAALRGIDGGDTDTASAALEALQAMERPFPLGAMVAADVGRFDETLAIQLRDERALAAYEELVGRDPDAIAATDQLAYIYYTRDRLDEALTLLNSAAEAAPNEYLIDYHRYLIFRDRRWAAQAGDALTRALDKHPTHCGLIDEQWTRWELMTIRPEPGEIPGEFFACDSTLLNLAMGHDLPRKNIDSAVSRLRTLIARNPNEITHYVTLARVLDHNGRQGEAEKVIAEARNRSRTQTDLELEALDLVARTGNEKAFRARLKELLEKTPENYLYLRRLGHLDRRNVLEDLRVDTEQTVATYLKDPQGTDTSAVYVLDYAATRVFPDGTSLTVTHVIVRVNNKEGIDNFGEVSIPPSALLMKINTIKPDGQKIEPDLTIEKETISMAALAPGDFVEYEYIESGEANLVREGSYQGFRFYFSIFDAPLLRSEYVIDLPKAWQPIIDRRNGAPEPTVSTEGEYKRYRFVVTDSDRAVNEPNAVPSEEFLPSIMVGHDFGFPDLHVTYRDRLMSLARPDREVRHIAETIEPQAKPRARARALFRWVVEAISDDGSGLFAAPAAHIASSGVGDRMLLLHTLLVAAGLRSEIVLVRLQSEDAGDEVLPKIGTWGTPIIRLELDEGVIWLDPTFNHARFGYITAPFQGARGIRLGDIDPRNERQLLVELPRLPPESDARIVELLLDVDGNGNAVGRGREVYSGSSAMQFRRVLDRFTDEKELRQAFAASMSASFPGLTITELEFEHRTDADVDLVMHYTFESSGLARREGDKLVVSRTVFPAELKSTFATLPARQTPMGIFEPLTMDITTRWRFADGATVLGKPDPAFTKKTPYGRIARDVAFDGAEVVEHRRIELQTGRVAPKQYRAFVEFAAAVEDNEKTDLTVKLSTPTSSLRTRPADPRAEVRR